ncbi:hypothetical protein LO763_19585 [Glycomyces sp. A-F 0318]|uniref:hypothetical protein n=1 Tax=Glycomyces amatae TaxID=2881355 RepID=UPI001E5A11F7|nr:hypothetical protein [Glycomyces amatae]MCD0445814.1 hypothetical protein [Glycomyces amatae]
MNLMDTIDVFNGPNGTFAHETVKRALYARACESNDRAWPAWSKRETVAVAIVLISRERLLYDEDMGFRTLPEAARFVSNTLLHPLGTDDEMKGFFAAIRARVDAEHFDVVWDGEPRAYSNC